MIPESSDSQHFEQPRRRSDGGGAGGGGGGRGGLVVRGEFFCGERGRTSGLFIRHLLCRRIKVISFARLS